MFDSGYLGQLAVGILYLFVGAGLLRLSARTGQKPERHLGLYFLFTGVDYFSYSIAAVFYLEALYVPTDFIARVAYVIAVMYLLIFIRTVFRPGETWAIWASVLCTLGLVTSLVATSINGDWAGPEMNDPWYWVQFLSYSSALLWMGIEALRAYSGSRKRLRIGLCDRAIVNRYMLWSCFGVFQVLACAAVLILAQDAAADDAVSGMTDMLLSATEVASIAALWLAFFPPAAYLSWITGAQENTNSPAEG
jgi:hypothetical protein